MWQMWRTHSPRTGGPAKPAQQPHEGRWGKVREGEGEGEAEEEGEGEGEGREGR